MSERRFNIREVLEPTEFSIDPVVTESELRTRFETFMEWLKDQYLLHSTDAFYQFLKILLHDEGKEPYIRAKCTSCGRDVWSDESLACPHDKAGPPAGLFHGPGLPKREPPTDAWEEWCFKLAHALITEPFYSGDTREEKVRQLLIEMPKR